MELLSPKIDIVFKMLFTSADSEDILTDFLASVLDIDNKDISNIKVLNTEVIPEAVEQKYSRLDIAMEAGGRLINVEMQLKKLNDFRERVLFYWSKLYTRDLREGDSYKNLRQTISINILDYNMFDCEECHSVFRLREENRNELLTDKCRFDFLELPKANTDSQVTGVNSARQIKRLRRWLNFFNLKSEEDADMVAQTDDKVMNKAVFILKKMSADERMREIARIRERALHDEASYLEDAREAGFNMGRAEGRAEGKAEGMAQGIEKMLEVLRSSGVDEKVLAEAAARAAM